MKKTSKKRKYQSLLNTMTFIGNAIVLLVAPANDLGDYFFKMVECMALIKIGLTSWKWHNSNNISNYLLLPPPVVPEQNMG